MDSKQQEAEEFFYQNAGWSYDPATETPDQGQRRNAAEMARDEAWAKREGIWFKWADDVHDDRGEEITTCEYALALDEDGETLASLGCIDDATEDYRRVIEAELASEARFSRDAWSLQGC